MYVIKTCTSIVTFNEDLPWVPNVCRALDKSYWVQNKQNFIPN